MKRILTFLLLVTVLGGCSKKSEPPKRDTYVYEPVRAVSAYIALVEKPTARRALLVGAEAKALSGYLTRAGVDCATTLGAKYDLIVVACEGMSKQSCAKLCESLAPDGVVVWLVNVEGVTAEGMLENFRGFGLGDVHLWMPGERRWLLVGRDKPCKVGLAAMLDVFAREGMFDDLAKARCGTLPEVFASYVGTANEVVPAFFQMKEDEPMRPELFLSEKVPAVDWIDGSDTDEDIRKSVLADVRSMQVMRREAVRAAMAAMAVKDKKGEEAVAERFAKVALRNPNELFVLERLDRLDRNARGFLEVGKILMALKCYETMVLIRPSDAAAVHNFGMCLKKIGKLDLAEKILARAKMLAERNGGDEKGAVR